MIKYHHSQLQYFPLSFKSNVLEQSYEIYFVQTRSILSQLILRFIHICFLLFYIYPVKANLFYQLISSFLIANSCIYFSTYLYVSFYEFVTHLVIALDYLTIELTYLFSYTNYIIKSQYIIIIYSWCLSHIIYSLYCPCRTKLTYKFLLLSFVTATFSTILQYVQTHAIHFERVFAIILTFTVSYTMQYRYDLFHRLNYLYGTKAVNELDLDGDSMNILSNIIDNSDLIYVLCNALISIDQAIKNEDFSELRIVQKVLFGIIEFLRNNQEKPTRSSFDCFVRRASQLYETQKEELSEAFINTTEFQQMKKATVILPDTISKKKTQSSKFINFKRNSLAYLKKDIKPEILDGIGCDVTLNLLSVDTKYPLLVIGSELLMQYADKIKISMARVTRFLSKLESCYLPNPYHNALHAASVAHLGMIFLKGCGLTDLDCTSFGPVEIIAFLIACLGHDAGHPGANYAWLTKISDPLTIIYSDKSPLEHMHSALILSILNINSTNIFIRVDPSHISYLRKQIVNLVLATDMTFSAKYISKFHSEFPDMDILSNNTHAWHAATICIKAADLGHCVLPREQHINWSLRIVEELYQQAEEELARGLQMTMKYTRQNHTTQFPHSQAFFLLCFAEPVFRCLKLTFSPNADMEWYKVFEDNLKYWVSMEEKEDNNEPLPTFEIPMEILRGQTYIKIACQPLLDIIQDLIKRRNQVDKNKLYFSERNTPTCILKNEELLAAYANEFSSDNEINQSNSNNSDKSISYLPIATINEDNKISMEHIYNTRKRKP